MADLRILFEELGFTDVRTVLNSGNVVFGGRQQDAAGAAAAIEAALVRRLGVASRVTVLRAAVTKLLGDATTSRNWNTLSKLQALCGVPGT
jgi:uncharacterized protein (DUF1697 family)